MASLIPLCYTCAIYNSSISTLRCDQVNVKPQLAGQVLSLELPENITYRYRQFFI